MKPRMKVNWNDDCMLLLTSNKTPEPCLIKYHIFLTSSPVCWSYGKFIPGQPKNLNFDKLDNIFQSALF